MDIKTLSNNYYKMMCSTFEGVKEEIKKVLDSKGINGFDFTKVFDETGCELNEVCSPVNDSTLINKIYFKENDLHFIDGDEFDFAFNPSDCGYLFDVYDILEDGIYHLDEIGYDYSVMDL